MSRPRFKGLNTEIAYPWPVDAAMPQDVSGLDMSEIIYGTSQIAGPLPEIGNENGKQ